jgi:hypothetical protein
MSPEMGHYPDPALAEFLGVGIHHRAYVQDNVSRCQTRGKITFIGVSGMSPEMGPLSNDEKRIYRLKIPQTQRASHSALGEMVGNNRNH